MAKFDTTIRPGFGETVESLFTVILGLMPANDNRKTDHQLAVNALPLGAGTPTGATGMNRELSVLHPAIKLPDHTPMEGSIAWQCPVASCQRSFTSPKLLTKHTNDVHAQKTVHDCPECTFVTTYKHELKYHMIVAHNAPGQLTCKHKDDGCTFVAAKLSALLGHESLNCRYRTESEVAAVEKEICGVGNCTYEAARRFIIDHRKTHERCIGCGWIAPTDIRSNDFKRRQHLEVCENKPEYVKSCEAFEYIGTERYTCVLYDCDILASSISVLKKHTDKHDVCGSGCGHVYPVREAEGMWFFIEGDFFGAKAAYQIAEHLAACPNLGGDSQRATMSKVMTLLQPYSQTGLSASEGYFKNNKGRRDAVVGPINTLLGAPSHLVTPTANEVWAFRKEQKALKAEKRKTTAKSTKPVAASRQALGELAPNAQRATNTANSMVSPSPAPMSIKRARGANSIDDEDVGDCVMGPSKAKVKTQRSISSFFTAKK